MTESDNDNIWQLPNTQNTQDTEGSHDEIPRHQPSNPYNYTNLELAERKNTLKVMERDYPKLPYAWLEMVYDFNKNTPKEEVDKIINESLWEGPGRFTQKQNRDPTKSSRELPVLHLNEIEN